MKTEEGETFYIDERDHYKVNEYKWHSFTLPNGRKTATTRTKYRNLVYLHTLIYRRFSSNNYTMEFINGNTMDLRRRNLIIKEIQGRTREAIYNPKKLELNGCTLTKSLREGDRCSPSYKCPNYTSCLNVVGNTQWRGWMAKGENASIQWPWDPLNAKDNPEGIEDMIQVMLGK